MLHLKMIFKFIIIDKKKNEILIHISMKSSLKAHIGFRFLSLIGNEINAKLVSDDRYCINKIALINE